VYNYNISTVCQSAVEYKQHYSDVLWLLPLHNTCKRKFSGSLYYY